MKQSMKQSIIPAISFITGALTMLACWTLNTSQPVAELTIWSSNHGRIPIPLDKTVAKRFERAGTNQMVIEGISVRALIK